MVPQAQLDLKVLAQQAHKVIKVHKDQAEVLWEQADPQVLKVRKEHRGLQVRKDREQRAQQDPQAHRACQVHKVHKVILVPRDLKEI